MTTTVCRSELTNGIRVITDRVDGVRSVSVGVLVDVGPKNELPDEHGYAHLLEHMLFQGTGERDANAIAEMMEVGGGAMGAFTARDYTVYHATVLDDYLPFALEVLGDMLCNSIVPEEALKLQIKVILNELAGHVDPSSLTNELLKQALWSNHPMGYPTAGTESSLLRATRQTLLDFRQRHYTTENLIIAAAGHVDHDSFFAQAQDSFWQMTRGSGRALPTSPIPNLNSVFVEPRDSQQVYFSIGWPAPSYTSEDRYAWHVFSTLFGGGSTSHLYRRLREERGMVYHIASEYQAYGNTGALVVEGATLPQTLVPVLAGIFLELMQMVEQAHNPDTYHRAIQSLISQHLISGDSAYVRMSRLALQELYFHRDVPSDEVIAGLQNQSYETVRQVGLQLLEAGLPTIALVGPVTSPLLQAVTAMLSDFGGQPQVILVSKNGTKETQPESPSLVI